MAHHRLTTRMAALCMLVILLHLSILAISAKTAQGLPSGSPEITQSCSLDKEAQQHFPHIRDFKPPKHSFTDYSVFLLTGSNLPVCGSGHIPEKPQETALVFPDVFYEIFIPPDIAA